MKTILHVLAALLLCGCATDAANLRLALPDNKAQCEAAGHRWGCRGVPGEGCPEVCHAATTDAGKSCTHSDQCQGACVAVDQRARSGVCSSQSTVFGCQFYLDSKRHPGGAKLCYD
jgi:hypothetical protein